MQNEKMDVFEVKDDECLEKWFQQILLDTLNIKFTKNHKEFGVMLITKLLTTMRLIILGHFVDSFQISMGDIPIVQTWIHRLY
jgi:hypothetical protein